MAEIELESRAESSDLNVHVSDQVPGHEVGQQVFDQPIDSERSPVRSDAWTEWNTMLEGQHLDWDTLFGFDAGS